MQSALTGCAGVKFAPKILRRAICNAVLPALELSVPLTADVGTGPNWAEAH